MRRKRLFFIMGGIFVLESLTLFHLFQNIPNRLNAGLIKPDNKTITISKQTYMDREQKAYKIYKENKDTLILVNMDNSLNQSYDADLRSICKGRLHASQKLYKPLVQMLEDAEKSGFHFWIASAHRSRSKQQKLIDEDVRKAMQNGLSYEEALCKTYQETMPAGHSEHETGLALDILCSENYKMDASQAKEAGNIWLRNHCHHYGFILRYPKGKENITGIHYEPWHFRYVGKEAATYIHKHNLTLEEFWEEVTS